jgi:predicted nucleic acid-binding protein
MSGEVVSLDTNILIYSIDLDSGGRHDTALALFQRLTPTNCVLSLQALCEFFSAVTRKRLMPVDDALAQMNDWQQLFPVVSARAATLGRATAGLKRYQLSFWDAMLWATVREAGVATLLSEDFQHGQDLEGVRIIDPFKLRNLDEVLSP